MKTSFLKQKIRESLQSIIEVNTRQLKYNLKTLLVRAINVNQIYDWVPLADNQGFFMIVCPVIPTDCEDYPLYEVSIIKRTHPNHVNLNEAFKELNSNLINPKDTDSINRYKNHLVNHYKKMIDDIHKDQTFVTVKTKEGSQYMQLNESITKLNVGFSIIEKEDGNQPYLVITTALN